MSEKFRLGLMIFSGRKVFTLANGNSIQAFNTIVQLDAPHTNGEHYTVYLPSYSDEKIFKILSQIKGCSCGKIFKNKAPG